MTIAPIGHNRPPEPRFPKVIITNRIGPGLAYISGNPCAECVARKTTTCAISGETIKPGDLVYRPLNNPMNRYLRYLSTAVEKEEQAYIEWAAWCRTIDI